MVVQHGQRVAASAIRQRQPPFEVHLPEQIRCSLLKPLTRRRASRRHNNATVSAQNLMHRRERRRLHALALKAACDLAGPPGGDLADRYGRKQMFIAEMALFICFILVLTFSPSYPLVVI